MNRNWTRCVAVLLACGGCLGPVLGWTEESTPNPRRLGIAEAIQQYCKKAYPASSSKWQFEVDRLTHGVSADTLGKLRASDAYRLARGAEEGFVGQIEPANAKRLCAPSVHAKKSAKATKPADESH